MNTLCLFDWDFSNLSISDTAAEAIASAVMECRELKRFSLHGCRFSTSALDCMLDALERLTNLKEVDLGRCEIGDDGANVILGFLRSHETIERLLLVEANLGANGKEIIKGIFSEVDRFMYIDFGTVSKKPRYLEVLAVKKFESAAGINLSPGSPVPEIDVPPPSGIPVNHLTSSSGSVGRRRGYTFKMQEQPPFNPQVGAYSVPDTARKHQNLGRVVYKESTATVLSDGRIKADDGKYFVGPVQWVANIDGVSPAPDGPLHSPK